MNTIFQSTVALIAASLVALLGGCSAGSGTGLDENGRPLSETQHTQSPDTGASGESSSLFTRIQDEILTPECATSGCHNGTSSPLGLNLVAGKAYDKLYEKPSNQVDGLLLVEPSNADASYLVHKIDGSAGGGAQMPLYKPPLSADQIDLVKQWINEGALPASASGNQQSLIQATLSDIQKYIFDTECISCHAGENPAGTLNLEKGYSYSQLVGRPLQFDPENSVLVVAGDAENSFLIHKLTGEKLGDVNDSDYKGSRMPLLGPYLDDTKVQVIKDWINAGALDN